MNKLFNAVNNLFESEESVTLTERGHKYIKKLPDDEVENPEYSYSKKDYIDTETGHKINQNDISSVSKKRIIFDVIKHLAPTGYHFTIGTDRWDGTRINLIKDGTDEGITLGNLKIDIDADDNVTVDFGLNKYDVQKLDLFNREVTVKDVAQELAKEKGAKLDDEFMIDNGAEIKAKYQELKSKNTGTAEDLAKKIEDQVKKLPSGALLKFKRTSESETIDMETIINEAKKADLNKEELNEDFDPSMPNWLKSTAIKGRNRWSAPTLDSNVQFQTLSKDDLSNITKMAKKAEADGQILFVRLGNSAFWYNDRRWRQCLDYNNQRSEADMVSAINNENNKASGCITLNFKGSRDENIKKASDRAEARKGGIYRRGEKGADNSYYSSEYDKSGYKLNPTKYQDMLRKLNQEKLASSSTIEDLKAGDYVNRFNELGKQAAQFIADNISISYKDGDKYDNFKMNTDAVSKVESYAEAASREIRKLMRSIDYVKSGDSSDLGYFDSPKSQGVTDLDKWLKDQAKKVESSLDAFENLITKVEAAVEESTKVEGKSLKEDFTTERTPADDVIYCIEDGTLTWEMVGMAALKYMSSDDIVSMCNDNEWPIFKDLDDFDEE